MSFLDWHVGKKVVCVDGKWPIPPEGWEATTFPQVGSTYTIRSFFPSGTKVFIRFDEIRNELVPTDIGLFEAAFGVRHFRPVQKRKISIEVFERLLTPSDKDKHLIEVFDFVSMQGDLQ